jgi:hypothetical protein
MKKNLKKCCFLSSIKYFNFTSKVIKRSQQKSIDNKGILKQSESEEAPRDNGIKLKSSKFSNSSG